MNIHPVNNVSFKGRLPIDKVMQKQFFDLTPDEMARGISKAAREHLQSTTRISGDELVRKLDEEYLFTKKTPFHIGAFFLDNTSKGLMFVTPEYRGKTFREVIDSALEKLSKK